MTDDVNVCPLCGGAIDDEYVEASMELELKDGSTRRLQLCFDCGKKLVLDVSDEYKVY